MALSLEKKLTIKELELNALFTTTRAINSNQTEDNLYKIFKFSLNHNRAIAKMALYVLEDEWKCKAFFGLPDDFHQKNLPPSFFTESESGKVPKGYPFMDDFDIVLPISHKSTLLAFVFLGAKPNEDIELLELDFIEALSNIIIVAIENKKMVRREQLQLEYNRQLDIAKDVQGLLFPKLLPYNQRIKIMASYLPHQTIGGDYYDYIDTRDNRFLICIADVSGKGIPAAILMSNFQAGLRTLSRKSDSLREIVNELNHLIMLNSQGENFITAFFLEYDFNTKALNYVNAGHNPPFLFHDNRVRRLEKGTTILGGFKELPFMEIGHLEGLEKFFVFCFTDGFIETYNEDGKEFGEEYLLNFISNHLSLDQKEMHTRLIALLNTFKGEKNYMDDITLLSCLVDTHQK